MPIYEYICRGLPARIRKLVRSSDAAPVCPHCASSKLTRKLSAFAAVTSGSQSAPTRGRAAPADIPPGQARVGFTPVSVIAKTIQVFFRRTVLAHIAALCFAAARFPPAVQRGRRDSRAAWRGLVHLAACTGADAQAHDRVHPSALPHCPQATRPSFCHARQRQNADGYRDVGQTGRPARFHGHRALVRRTNLG